MQSVYDVAFMEYVLDNSGTLAHELCDALHAMTEAIDVSGQSGLVLAVKAFDHLMRTTARAALMTSTTDCDEIIQDQPHHMDIMHAAVLTSAVNASGAPWQTLLSRCMPAANIHNPSSRVVVCPGVHLDL